MSKIGLKYVDLIRKEIDVNKKTKIFGLQQLFPLNGNDVINNGIFIEHVVVVIHSPNFSAIEYVVFEIC